MKRWGSAVSKQKYEINMTEGSVFKNMVMFVVPLIFGNLLQLLYNAADIIVVSRWAGSSAMASVGATSSVSSLIVNMCIGLSVGASIVVSQRYGAGNNAIIGMILGISLSRPLLTLMGTPEGRVLDGAVLYMRIYFAAIPATMVYNFGAAILRAIGDTKRPLYILSATGVVNVILNLVFVIVFHLDVAGVAIATGIASYLSAISVIIILTKTDGACKLVFKEIRFYKAELTEALTIGIPAGLQSSMFAIANTVIQSAVNSFGTAVIAGNSAASNIEGFVYTAMNAFYQATVTSVSQNYGAKNEKRVKRSMYVALGCVTVVGFVLGIATVIFSRPLLSIYITDSAEAIEAGMVRVMYNGIPYFLCGIMEVIAGALRGLGYSSITLINALIGSCALRLVWVFCILPLNRTFGMLYLCWPISWVITIILHFSYYLYVRKSAMEHMREV